MRILIICSLIILCMSATSNSYLATHSLFFKTASKHSLALLLTLSHAARIASAKALGTSKVMAIGMAHHPRLSAVCIAGLLIAVPKVRKVTINKCYWGISTLCAAVSHWTGSLLSSIFLGGVNSKLARANTVLDTHTEQLNTIQTGVQTAQNQINSVSQDLHAVQNQLGTVANDVTAVHGRVNESYDVLRAVQETGQSHGQVLGAVQARCDEIYSVVTNCNTQLVRLTESFTLLDGSFDERVRRQLIEQIDLVQNQIREQGSILNELRQQLEAIRQSITSQNNNFNERLNRLEANQEQRFEQMRTDLQTGLQQILQRLSQQQQVQLNVRTVMPSCAAGRAQGLPLSTVASR